LRDHLNADDDGDVRPSTAKSAAGDGYRREERDRYRDHDHDRYHDRAVLQTAEEELLLPGRHIVLERTRHREPFGRDLVHVDATFERRGDRPIHREHHQDDDEDPDDVGDEPAMLTLDAAGFLAANRVARSSLTADGYRAHWSSLILISCR